MPQSPLSLYIIYRYSTEFTVVIIPSSRTRKIVKIYPPTYTRTYRKNAKQHITLKQKNGKCV